MQKEYVLQFAKELLSIDSPTGYTQQAISFVEQEVQSMGYRTKRTNKRKSAHLCRREKS